MQKSRFILATHELLQPSINIYILYFLSLERLLKLAPLLRLVSAQIRPQISISVPAQVSAPSLDKHLPSH